MYAGSRGGQLWFAVVLIALGVIFLVQNYIGVELGRRDRPPRDEEVASRG